MQPVVQATANARAIDGGSGRERVQEPHVAGRQRRANVGFRQVRPEVDAQLVRLDASSGVWSRAMSLDMAAASIERAVDHVLCCSRVSRMTDTPPA